MGSQACAWIVFGFGIGGDASGWAFAEADENGGFDYHDGYADPDDEDGDELSVELPEDQMDAKLRAAKELAVHPGTKIEIHSSGYSTYAVGICIARVSQGEVETIDFAEAEKMREDQDWDGLLAKALKVLNITPHQEKPGWLLMTTYL